jgi:hypothetical protein
VETHGVEFDVYVNVHHYRIDGSRIAVSITNDRLDDWHTVFDSRVIADSFWEAMLTSLCEGLEIDTEYADVIACGWGIYPPEDDEE